ncbi:hypothetical protein LINPERHAP1_LOCUS4798 [Linum perenne]
MYSKAQSWKSQLLSHAGKETMLKAVIQAIPSYIMSIFYISKGLRNRMNSILRQFFWSGPTKRDRSIRPMVILSAIPNQKGVVDFATSITSTMLC